MRAGDYATSPSRSTTRWIPSFSANSVMTKPQGLAAQNSSTNSRGQHALTDGAPFELAAANAIVHQVAGAHAAAEALDHLASDGDPEPPTQWMACS